MNRAGGSHGGRGGNSSSTSGNTYGSDVAPITLGSGGGNNVWATGSSKYVLFNSQVALEEELFY